MCGAEKLLRENGKRTGVVLNPLVGQLKGDDVPADVRMQTYEALVQNRELGRGDLDEQLWKRCGQRFSDQLELVGLDMRMYYGGPSEAVMHAIYRQNLGFTHFIIGRKHADAPYDDKTPIWGDFDAQEIFRKLGGELVIQTVNVGFAAYFEELGRVGLVEDNPDAFVGLFRDEAGVVVVAFDPAADPDALEERLTAAAEGINYQEEGSGYRTATCPRSRASLEAIQDEITTRDWTENTRLAFGVWVQPETCTVRVDCRRTVRGWLKVSGL